MRSEYNFKLNETEIASETYLEFIYFKQKYNAH